MTRARDLADSADKDIAGTLTLDGLTVDGGSIKLDGNYPTGTANVALGDTALSNATSADSVVALGFQAALSNTSGSANTAVGRGSLYTNSTGNNNTGIGYQALVSNTTASNNTAVGYQAAYSTTTGSYSTSVGYQAHYSNTTGRNSALGYVALRSNTTGTSNTAVGDSALYSSTTGNYNTALGQEALTSNTTASYSTAVGYQAGYTNTTGKITAVGAFAGYSNTTGSSNLALGGYDGTTSGALFSNTTGSYNVAVGTGALRTNTTASSNTAVGYQAGYVITTGTDNTFLGTYAGEAATTGASNTFVGRASGNTITTGAKNTILGRYNGNQGGLDIRTSNNNIVLSDGDGNPRFYFTNSQWHSIIVDNNKYHTRFLVQGNHLNPYGPQINYSDCAPDNYSGRFLTCGDNVGTRLSIYNDGDVANHDNSYGALSDIKLKEQITDASSQWDDIKALNVRKYKMKSDVLEKGDSDEHWRLGVVAQEVEAAGMSGLIKDTPDIDADNNDLGTTTKVVKYSILYMKAVKALQEAMDRIETLEAKVTALENA